MPELVLVEVWLDGDAVGRVGGAPHLGVTVVGSGGRLADVEEVALVRHLTPGHRMPVLVLPPAHGVEVIARGRDLEHERLTPAASAHVPREGGRPCPARSVLRQRVGELGSPEYATPAARIAAVAHELGITETTAPQHLSGLYRRTRP